MDARRVAAVLLVLSMARSVTAPDPRCLKSLELGNSDCSRASIRYYYDQDNGACQTFRYTGCGGNDNNFGDEDTCKKCCEW